MKQIPAQLRARYPHLLCGVPLFLCIALSLSGCSLMRKPKPSIPWATAVQARPVLLARSATADEAALQAPELNLELEPLAALLLPVRTAPLRPHVSAGTSAGAGSDPEKAVVPTIAPQLTAQESVAAQQDTNQSLSIADKNLAAVRGKPLNAAQRDRVSKIQGFLKDAREAAQAGDWERARNLAKKAQVLSEDLVDSI
jgi:hypothetical protein